MLDVLKVHIIINIIIITISDILLIIAQPPGALGFGAHSPAPMVSQVMLNPTMDNFTNLDPTAIICPPRPVSLGTILH